MSINLTKAMTAAGVGVADELLERQAAGKHIGSWSYSDIARVLAVLGGFGMGEFMPRYGGIGETVGIAATPLLVKTLAAKFVAPGTGKLDFAPRDIGARARNWVPSEFAGASGGYRAMRVTS